VCWGAQQRWADLPISNLPANAIKVRRRIRNNAPVKAFVKTADNEIHQFILVPDGTISECKALKLALRQGINKVESK
jgi:hypothetical protein